MFSTTSAASSTLKIIQILYPIAKIKGNAQSLSLLLVLVNGKSEPYKEGAAGPYIKPQIS